ncbi:hypothetical protein HWV62_15477 [Athelia sp. TMB]|nr:hypothetical protein HWV62_15477 [Athelia sp. TMB]
MAFMKYSFYFFDLPQTPSTQMAGTALFLALFLVQTCVAPAVNNDHDDLAPYTLDSVITPRSAGADQSNRCGDIDNCRTLASIVISCLGTIFACVWVAVHKNMPGPEQTWISVQLESLKVVIMTLLVPEWVLAWAVRQFLRAREIAKELEEARLSAFKRGRGDDAGREGGDAREDDDETRLLGPQTTSESISERPTFTVELWDLEEKLGRTDQPWTIVHGFFIIMGGFHYYRNGKPMWAMACGSRRGLVRNTPYEDKDVRTLVQSRTLVPPTVDELGDKSKGDTLSKTVAVTQTLWFIAQCIARRAQGIVITNLEIMTLAYTVITVAMYAAWWHKPLNVRCPVRVKGDLSRAKKTHRFDWTDVIDYVTGDQDSFTSLHERNRVPTFWSDSSSLRGKIPLHADIIALSVAVVFGAVHCAAWPYTFPSPTEKALWRASALAITAIPIPMAVAFVVFDPFDAADGPNGLYDYIPLVCMALGGLLYIPARIILLALSFSTLRNLPLSAFQTVQWTTFVPHI